MANHNLLSWFPVHLPTCPLAAQPPLPTISSFDLCTHGSRQDYSSQSHCKFACILSRVSLKTLGRGSQESQVTKPSELAWNQLNAPSSCICDVTNAGTNEPSTDCNCLYISGKKITMSLFPFCIVATEPLGKKTFLDFVTFPHSIGELLPQMIALVLLQSLDLYD